MRALIVALVVMIVAVASGTAALVFLRLKDAPPSAAASDKPASKPPTPAKPSEKKPDDKPADQPPPEQGPKAEELPPIPKLSDKSKLTPLNKEKTLYLETAEGGEKRVLFVAEVCLKEGVLLEVFCCKKQTKEHESILSVDADARFIHAALVAAGAKAGKPVQFVNQKTMEADYQPASGQRIAVEVAYTKGGKAKQEKAQEWILDENTKNPMDHDWVFAGSRFVQDPDRPNDPPYYTANNGEVIAISNFVDSMLDLPVEVGRSEKDLYFKAVEKKIPPPGSKVWVILSPIGKKDEKK